VVRAAAQFAAAASQLDMSRLTDPPRDISLAVPGGEAEARQLHGAGKAAKSPCISDWGLLLAIWD